MVRTDLKFVSLKQVSKSYRSFRTSTQHGGLGEWSEGRSASSREWTHISEFRRFSLHQSLCLTLLLNRTRQNEVLLNHLLLRNKPQQMRKTEKGKGPWIPLGKGLQTLWEVSSGTSTHGDGILRTSTGFRRSKSGSRVRSDSIRSNRVNRNKLFIETGKVSLCKGLRLRCVYLT